MQNKATTGHSYGLWPLLWRQHLHESFGTSPIMASLETQLFAEIKTKLRAANIPGTGRPRATLRDRTTLTSCTCQCVSEAASGKVLSFDVHQQHAQALLSIAQHTCCSLVTTYAMLFHPRSRFELSFTALSVYLSVCVSLRAYKVFSNGESKHKRPLNERGRFSLLSLSLSSLRISTST